MQNPIIEIRQLYKKYGTIEALRGITFAVNQGTVLMLVGPNGSGKTTLIRILATLSRPTSGDIRLYGVDPNIHGTDIRKHIGVVLHQSLLYPSLTADENLRFYGKMFRLAHLDETLEDLLDKVGLLDRRNDCVRTFSRGMQQRLSIARSLLHNPSILLLDEPYAGLDKAAVKTFQLILENFRNEGRTVVLTTHNYEEGFQLCDKVVVIVGGRLLFIETPEIARQKLQNSKRGIVKNS